MILRVEISKQVRGGKDYIQVMSDDLTSVNVVLVADKIEVRDTRLEQQLQKREDR